MRTRVVALVLLPYLGACTAERPSAEPAPSEPRASGAPGIERPAPAPISTAIADTAPSLGELTLREVPMAPASPECLPEGLAVCFADTTQAAPPTDGWTAPTKASLVFAHAGDTTQMFGRPDRAAGNAVLLVTLGSPSQRRHWQEHLAGLTAPFIRFRFPASGLYIAEVMLDGAPRDSTAYELRVMPVAVSEVTRLSGEKAGLTLVADSTARVAIVPQSIAATLANEQFQAWSVEPGSYTVLLVRDSVYEACRIPCTRPRSIVLRPNADHRLTF